MERMMIFSMKFGVFINLQVWKNKPFDKRDTYSEYLIYKKVLLN